MIRMVLVSVVLLGMIAFFIFRWQALVQDAQPPRVTRVDIYRDRLTYRNSFYATPANLAIGLKANNDPPRLIQVHHCAALPRLPEVLEIVRAEGATDLEILLPEGC